ncbi:MAG: ABC transporter ATP-binding protein [Chitinophagaceae bacterium]
MKDILNKYFSTLVYFYRYLRYRIFLVVGLTFVYGVMDGFGLSMFLPLFQIASDREERGVSSTAGSDNGMVQFFRSMHIDFTLSNMLLIMFLFFLFKGIFFYVKGVNDARVSRYFITRVRRSFVGKFSKLDYKHFVMSDIGRIQNLMTGETNNLFYAFKDYLSVLQSAVMVLVYMVFAFAMNAQFALFIVVGGVLFNFIFQKIYKYTKTASGKLVKAGNNYQGMVIQLVSNFKYLKATGTVPTYAKKINGNIDEIEHINFRMGKLSALSNAIREPILIGIVALVILLQVYVLGGRLSTIIVSLLFFYRALASVSNLQSAYNSFIARHGTMENVADFQKEMDEHKEVQGSQPFTHLENVLSLRDVCFSYENYHILKKLNLDIKRNTTVAFVGESGSGKTTLINVIAGLLVNTDGLYLVDKVDIKVLDRESFQKKIGYISQDATIFNDSIYNNVTLWADKNDEANIAKFQKAIADAQLGEFIRGLENAEDTLLGNNGINVSGGQKQRISIARELFKDVEVLILDEATSALDSETEKYIQESIDSLKGSCTILIVAHRLATVKNADEIVLMKNGTILDVDSFDNLKEKSPVFKRMVELQEV